MLFVIEGPSTPDQLGHAFDAIGHFLSENGVTSVTGLHLNGIVHSGDARLQVKLGDEIGQVNVQRSEGGSWTVQPSGTVEPRDDRPLSPFASLFNHDD